MRQAPLRLLGPCLAIALAACSGGNPAAPGMGAQAQPGGTRPSWWREAPDSARAGVYVAQANGSGDGLVFGYGAHDRSNEAPQCSIGGQQFQETLIATDPSGNLYLPNFNGTVAIYAPHCGNLIKTVSDPNGGGNVFVAVDGSNFYTGNTTHVSACSMSGCTRVLTDPSIFQLESVAVDHSGNVWGSYYNQGFAISLIVWVGGQMPGRIVNGYVNQNTPGALSFDKHNSLVSLQSRFFHVYVYRCNAGTAACTNTQTFNLNAASIAGALNAKNTDYQVTDYANDSVDVYAYPSFKYEYSYSNGLMTNYSVEGIAQSR